jgi:ribosome-binding protein aMBF1 (putative translation factor)
MKRTKKKKVTPRSATAVDMYIGARIRDGRTALGLSQKGLAKKLGVSFQQVQKYEKGGEPCERWPFVRYLQGFEGPAGTHV